MFKTSLSQWTAAAAAAAVLILVVVAAADDSTVGSRHHDILNTLPRHTNYKAVHKLEGHKATLKCQLFDGSVWSKCVWRHKQNSAVISRESNGHSYQEPYDPESDRVIVNADYNQCNLVIRRVNRTLDEGDWYCNLTKDVGGGSSSAVMDIAGPASQQSWYEVTMYKLKVAKQTTMQISGPVSKQIRLGVPQMFECSVSNGQLNPIMYSIIRNGTVVRKNTFQPHETNISADKHLQRALFEYTSTINDTYGTTKINCVTEVSSSPQFDHGMSGHRRGGHRQPHRRHIKQELSRTVSLPEIRFKPVLMESSPDLDKMRLRCMDNAEPKSSMRTMVFRSNPLPQLKLFVTNSQDHVYSEDEVDFKVSDIDGYEVSVTVDLDGVKDLKQASLQASNEVGSYTVELLCPPKTAAGTHATSCSMFHVFDCPNSSAYTQIAVTAGIVVLLSLLVFSLILCCYLARKRRGLCQKMLGIQSCGVNEGEKLNTPHRIFIEDADRSGVSSGTSSSDSGSGGRVIVNPSHPFENTTIVAKINFGPKGSALLQGPNAASGLDHVYSEISDEFQSASSRHSSGVNTGDRDPVTETTILRTSSCLDESDGDGDTASSLSAEDLTQSTFIPKQQTRQSNYLQATTTATINPRGVGGYTFNPFKCDSGIDKTSPPEPRRPHPQSQHGKHKPRAAPAAAKPPMPNYSRQSSTTSSDQELDVSFNITYDKLDFDRARHTLRPHYQSSETLKSFKYSTNI